VDNILVYLKVSLQFCAIVPQCMRCAFKSLGHKIARLKGLRFQYCQSRFYTNPYQSSVRAGGDWVNSNRDLEGN
jgi:hypothetical protein